MIFFLGHQPTPQEAALELIQDWDIVHKPHIILDAAFGSLQLGEKFQEANFLFTMGVNRARKEGWLFGLMEKHLCKGEGRVMVNKDKIKASVFFDNKMHCVITNAWKENGGDDDEMSEESEESEENEDEIDEEESNNNGDDDDNDDNNEGNDVEDHPGAEWEIIEVNKRMMKGKITYFNVLWSTEEETWEIFSSFVDETRVSQAFLQFANESDWNEGLNKWNVEKLKKLCISLGDGLSRSM